MRPHKLALYSPFDEFPHFLNDARLRASKTMLYVRDDAGFERTTAIIPLKPLHDFLGRPVAELVRASEDGEHRNTDRSENARRLLRLCVSEHFLNTVGRV